MRSIWNGAITFGLVSIPVGLYTAVDEKSLRFNMLHAKDKARVKQKRVCSECGEDVEWEDLARGFEYEKGHYVVFTDDELSRVPADSFRAVDIVAFVPESEIDPIYFNRSYYLVPEQTGLKAYRLLEKALKDTGRVGVAKISLRDKERIAALRLRDGVFVLETMYWPDEVREAEFDLLEKDVEIRKQELDMAKDLVENLSGAWEPGQFEDEYRARLEAAVQAKIDGQEVTVASSDEPQPVGDLMEALKASVEKTKKASKPKAKPKAKAKAG